MSQPSLGFFSGAPAYGANGQNLLGMNSPIRSMAGDNVKKQQELADFYRLKSQLKPPALEGMQLQGMFEPDQVDPSRFAQELQRRRMENKFKMGQLEGAQQAGQQNAQQGGGPQGPWMSSVAPASTLRARVPQLRRGMLVEKGMMQ